MKNLRAFTRIELLVITFCIVLLLAVSLQGLNLPREMARQIACANILKIFGQANSNYASDWNDYCVPAGVTTWYINNNGVQTTSLTTIKWLANKAFREYLNIDTYRDSADKISMANWGTAYSVFDNYSGARAGFFPYEYICPSDKNTKAAYEFLVHKKIDSPDYPFVTPIQYFLDGVLMSYGYNLTDWTNGGGVTWGGIWGNLGTVVGYKIDDVNNPSEKLMFTEGVGDFWVDWKGAYYEKSWDKYGYASNGTYRSSGYYGYGCVAYRHSEGAKVLFYDGHVQWMAKQDMFHKEDWDVPNAEKQPGIWAVNNPYTPPPPPPDDGYEE